MIYGTHPRKTTSEQGHFGDLALVVEDAVEELRPFCSRFDSIVVRGISGVVVGAPVALALKKPLVVVRKPDDNCHSGAGVLGLRHLGTQACFVDDFVSMGATRRAVQEAIRPAAELVLQYTYKDNMVVEIPRESASPA